MAEQKNTRLVKTLACQYYGSGVNENRALSVQYLESNLSLGIHGPLPVSQQSANAKYDYKTGHIIYLSGKKAKMLARFIVKAMKALENDDVIESTSISSATNLIEVCDGTKFGMEKGITIVIYNNISENKTTEDYDVFQFRNEDIIIDYNFKTGSYSKNSMDADVDYFVENLKEFAKACTNAGAHFNRKEMDYNIRQITTRQLQCMEALGIKIETAYTARTSWNNSNDSGAVRSTMSSADLINELESLGE
jgi:hypothetical protein